VAPVPGANAEPPGWDVPSIRTGPPTSRARRALRHGPGRCGHAARGPRRVAVAPHILTGVLAHVPCVRFPKARSVERVMHHRVAARHPGPPKGTEIASDVLRSP
jgi:hypothetical protein